MAKRKGNRQLYKLVNKETGTFYVTTLNRINKMPKELSKFDPKIKKHAAFTVKKFK